MKVTTNALIENSYIGDLDANTGLWCIDVDGVPIVGIDFAYCGVGSGKAAEDVDPETGVHDIVVGYWEGLDVGNGEWRPIHRINMADLRRRIEEDVELSREEQAWHLVEALAELTNDHDKFQLIERARELLGTDSA